MKRTTVKKILLPLCCIALCLITVKTPVIPSSPEDVAQLMPLCDMEDSDDTIEQAVK